MVQTSDLRSCSILSVSSRMSLQAFVSHHSQAQIFTCFTAMTKNGLPLYTLHRFEHCRGNQREGKPPIPVVKHYRHQIRLTKIHMLFTITPVSCRNGVISARSDRRVDSRDELQSEITPFLTENKHMEERIKNGARCKGVYNGSEVTWN